MAVEAGTFTPTSATPIITLNNSDLQVETIELSIGRPSSTGARQGSGFSDGTNHRSKCSYTYSTKRGGNRSSTYAIILEEDVDGTVEAVIQGKPAAGGFATPGEFEMDFNEYIEIPIDFRVSGPEV